MTLDDLNRRFPDEETARAHLFKLRWPNGEVVCPRCKKSDRAYRRAAGKKQAVSYKWICKTKKTCDGYGFSITTGTIFQDTKIPLRLWFRTLFVMLTAKKGLSALQMQRTIFGQVKRKAGKNVGKVVGKGSYETTWYMCHRLRAAMKDPHFLSLTGVVEVDETYIGGKDSNKHKSKRLGPGKRGWPHKIPVVGAIARKGNVVCKAIDVASSKVLTGFVNEVVDSEVSLIATDENPAYHRLTLKDRLPHETVNHSRGEYVRGVVHTANLDSFWSLVKRGIMGSYHKVSWGHLPLYLNEFSYRHNNRGELIDDVFDRVLAAC